MNETLEYLELLADIRSTYSRDVLLGMFTARTHESLFRRLAVARNRSYENRAPMDQAWLGYELATNSKMLRFYPWYR